VLPDRANGRYEFVENDETHAGQVIGEPPRAAIASLGFRPIDEIDDVVEPAAGAGADAASGKLPW
jgi:hypothetical protein